MILSFKIQKMIWNNQISSLTNTALENLYKINPKKIDFLWTSSISDLFKVVSKIPENIDISFPKSINI